MSSNLESLGRLRVQGIVLLAVMSVIGALAGAAFERTRAHRPSPPPPAPKGLPAEMREALRLTSAQEARIDSIMETSRHRTDAILNEFMPKLRAATDSIRTEVRAVLTSDQQKIFDRMQPPHGEPPEMGNPRLGPPPGSKPPGGQAPGDRPPGGPPPGDRPRGDGPPGERPPGDHPPEDRPPGDQPPPPPR